MTDVRAEHAQAFRAAWTEFASTCAHTVAPEAAYQAWLAHFLMNKIDVLRVVREVDVGSRHLLPEAQRRFPGSNLMLDIAVLRAPEVYLPRRALLRRGWIEEDGTPDPGTGLERLKHFSVISELKVASTQGEGLDQAQVLRDFYKLSAILNAAAGVIGEDKLPVAFVGLLANHAEHPYGLTRLQRKLQELREAGAIRADVHLLHHVADRPN